MRTCTFFGHRDTPAEAENMLRKVLTDLIVNNEVRRFLVGNEGNFDKMVIRVLKEIKNEFPSIRYNVVLAYLPEHDTGEKNTIFPEGIESVPKRFAIDFRNKWMISCSDCVVAYVNRNFGGAEKFVGVAEKRGLTVINIVKQNA